MADVVKGLAVATIGYHIVLTTLLAVTGWYVWNLHGEVIELSSYIHDVKEFRRAAIPHTRVQLLTTVLILFINDTVIFLLQFHNGHNLYHRS